MALSLVTAPSGEPISLTEAKNHLYVDMADDDDLIRGLIAASRQYAESYTHRALLTQTWDLKLDGFPCDVLTLPMPPVSSITSISYLDQANVSQVWSTSDYLTDLPSGPKASPARITPAYGVPWPFTLSVMNAVTVRFVCGYGTAKQVPDGILAAMKLLIGHWFEHRDAVHVGTGDTVTEVPRSVDALLWQYKAF